MVSFPSLTQADVMVGGNGVRHIFIRIQLPGEGDALLDYHLDMVALMCLVEMVIPWDDMLLDIVLEFFRYVLKHIYCFGKLSLCT